MLKLCVFRLWPFASLHRTVVWQLETLRPSGNLRPLCQTVSYFRRPQNTTLQRSENAISYMSYKTLIIAHCNKPDLCFGHRSSSCVSYVTSKNWPHFRLQREGGHPILLGSLERISLCRSTRIKSSPPLFPIWHTETAFEKVCYEKRKTMDAVQTWVSFTRSAFSYIFLNTKLLCTT
jgi:hypothetical protein